MLNQHSGRLDVDYLARKIIKLALIICQFESNEEENDLPAEQR